QRVKSAPGHLRTFENLINPGLILPNAPILDHLFPTFGPKSPCISPLFPGVVKTCLNPPTTLSSCGEKLISESIDKYLCRLMLNLPPTPFSHAPSSIVLHPGVHISNILLLKF